jgi:phosphatidylserine/phosphatidylglycerophosphate/cardiolipin synthase-like enzyme
MRWRAATGEQLDLSTSTGTMPTFPPPSIRLPAGPVALSETRPRTAADPHDHLEIRQLYRDAIAASEHMIYLENQYLSSQMFFECLVARMREAGRHRLEIVMVLPKQLPSWVEAAAMGPPRISMLRALREVAKETGHELGVYYSAAGHEHGKEVSVVIHSKVLIVDDRFLSVGSANTNNRSMGLDTELNVSWETAARDQLRRAIRRVRVSLLSEHGGLARTAKARRGLYPKHGLVKRLNSIASKRRYKLRILTDEAVFEDRDWLRNLTRSGFSYDPDGPALDEGRYEASPAAGRSRIQRMFNWVYGHFRR